jgi:hypothetical protein
MSREGEADAVVREEKECVGVTELLTLKCIISLFTPVPLHKGVFFLVKGGGVWLWFVALICKGN